MIRKKSFDDLNEVKHVIKGWVRQRDEEFSKVDFLLGLNVGANESIVVVTILKCDFCYKCSKYTFQTNCKCLFVIIHEILANRHYFLIHSRISVVLLNCKTR